MSLTAFVYPGQASQYVGMGKDLHDRYALARRLYDEAKEVLAWDVAEVSFYGPAEELSRTAVTQPTILVHSFIVTELLREAAVYPDSTAGHSLGEYSACVAAGALTFSDALEIVRVRAEEMQAACAANPGAMAALTGVDAETANALCEEARSAGLVQIANYNAPSQTVITGSKAGVEATIALVKERGIGRAIPLDVSGAFHSPLMHSACEALSRALASATIATPRVPVYMNVSAKRTRDPETIRQSLVEQLDHPVLWTESIEQMIRDGATHFVEVGPGKVLQGLVRRIDRSVEIGGVGTVADIVAFEGSLAVAEA